MAMPKVNIAGLEVSRLIVGGNPFSANSHRSAELSRQMRDYYTTAKIKETLRECERCGITTIQARGDNHIMRVLNEYWNEGGALKWIAQTASERASVRDNLRQIASFGAAACYHHGSRTDRLWREGEMDVVRDHLCAIRDTGMIVGLGTHHPDVVRYAEDRGYDVDFYMVSFYDLPSRGGEFYLEEDRAEACRVIREAEKPCLAFKIMAAGRNDPEEAFRVAFEQIKPSDAVVVGVFPKNHPKEIEQDAGLTERFGGVGKDRAKEESSLDE